MKSVGEVISGIQHRLSAPKPETVPFGNLPAWADFFRFDLRGNDPQIWSLIAACGEFCKAMKAGQPPYWLTLLGGSGIGKTHLAKQIFNWHLRSGLFRDGTVDRHGLSEVEYAREWCWWPDLAGMLKGNEGYALVRDMASARFAVIDEIGAELDKSGHVTNCLSNALCARVGKWTIITSNKSLGDIQRELDPRVSSRMLREGSKVISVELEDYNLWKRKL